MPSLRQRVTTYFRQLSFINEPRDGSRLASSLSPRSQDDGCFITRYLEGRMSDSLNGSPEISNGKEPTDLPDLTLARYPIGIDVITAACTGPDEGLTGIKRSKLHLSAGPDIAFIDTQHDQDLDVRHSISNQQSKNRRYGIRAATATADQNANKSLTTSSTTSTTTKRNNYNNSNSNISRKNSVQSQHETNETLTTLSTSASSHHQIGGPAGTATTTAANNKLKDDLNRNITSSKNNLAPTQKSRPNSMEIPSHIIEIEPIAGVLNWKQDNDHAYGLSVSLYEKNSITGEPAGNPIADCYGLVARGNCVAMALADGVNWGEGARLAARSAVQGSLEYLNTAVFGLGPGGMTTSTREVFVSLLRSFWEAHACILEVGGALSTLTVAVVLPLSGGEPGRYVVCSCNVGDSLGYVYSKAHGVREFTQGSHDITSMRDMRDALGALGPVDGKDPELGNLTLSLTAIDEGDIIFLTSDGISDNFDPVVGKFAEALTAESQQLKIEPKTISVEASTSNNSKNSSLSFSGLAPKRQNKSSSAIYSTSPKHKNEIMKSGSASRIGNFSIKPTTSSELPIRPSRSKKNQQPVTPVLSLHNAELQTSSSSAPSRPKYMRSYTVIEPRIIKSPAIKFPKSSAGLPLVTGVQRHALTLLRLEDLLSYGINGTLRPCTSAKKLCHLLVDFAKMITSAKRKILEQRELFYKITTRPDGIKREIELNRLQQRSARKKIVDGSTFALLPGKLDHATVVAFTVGCDRTNILNQQQQLHAVGFTETNF